MDATEPPDTTSGGGNGTGYLEIYNNSDTTIFLDGKLVVHGFWYVSEQADRPCESLAPWRADPEGIWSEWHVRIPGSGRSYPLLPGEAAVLATDAINHSEFSAGLPDLSSADFEGIGSPDVDNPAVPNLVDVGFRRWDTALGHGFFMGGDEVIALTEAVDLEALPVDRVRGLRDPDYRRFPAESILDVASLYSSPQIQSWTNCDPVVHPRFDRAVAEILPNARQVISAKRKVLGTTSSGRAILQRTFTSASDFELGPLTPGVVP